MIKLGVERHLGHKAFLLMLLRRVSVGVAFFVCLLVISSFGESISSVIREGLGTTGAIPIFGLANIPTIVAGLIAFLLLLAILLILIGILISVLEYRNYTYKFEEFNLVMKHGILNRKEVSVPYRQMQDININRSLAYQLLGVSRLIIDSAGHEEQDEQNETDIILEPLDRAEAEDIRVFLDRKIGVQVVKDEKVADDDSFRL